MFFGSMKVLERSTKQLYPPLVLLAAPSVSKMGQGWVPGGSNHLRICLEPKGTSCLLSESPFSHRIHTEHRPRTARTARTSDGTAQSERRARFEQAQSVERSFKCSGNCEIKKPQLNMTRNLHWRCWCYSPAAASV